MLPATPPEDVGKDNNLTSPYGYPGRFDPTHNSGEWPLGPPSIKSIDVHNPSVTQYLISRLALLKWVTKHISSCVTVKLFLYAKDSISPFEHTVLFTMHGHGYHK